ncbi:hypothetical protein ID866_7328 [Astraeus odoratus]|nr:hypothetical protein ID866_7328 [Astraeus odoratus]
MASALLRDPMASSHPPSSTGPRFRPYASSKHQVTKGRYITSNDPRGYIPVYEYPLNGQWIMMDIDDGYILWTGIWKALGNSKADIVKMIDSQPDLASVIRRVRGGYLKIQGTWMPYEVALRLSRRWVTFYTIQSSTLSSWSSPGPGSLHLSSATLHSSSDLHAPPSHTDGYAFPSHRLPHHSDGLRMSPPHQRGYITSSSSSSSPLVRERSIRYSPYPGPQIAGRKLSATSASGSVSSVALHEHSDLSGASNKLFGDQIKLAPIQPLAPPRTVSYTPYALPPISALEDLRGVSSQDSAAVLERLKVDDDRKIDVDENTYWPRQRSSSSCTAVSRYAATLWIVVIEYF